MRMNEYDCTPTPQRPQDANEVYTDDKGRKYVWRSGMGWTLATDGQDRFNRMNPFYVPIDESIKPDDMPSIEDDEESGIDANGFVTDLEPNKTTGNLIRIDKHRTQPKSNEDMAYIYCADGTMLMGHRDRFIQGLNKKGEHINNATEEYNKIKDNPIFQRMLLALNKLGQEKTIDYVVKKHHSGWVDYVYSGKTFKKMNEFENIQRITESQLRTIVTESVKKVLKEWEYDSRKGEFGENNFPSPEEEEFEYEFTSLIDSYQEIFLNRGWKIEDFKKWCHEMIDKE